jgi:2-C-methyl-D-erythritol 4-phosphate cytidylyltransferase
LDPLPAGLTRLEAIRRALDLVPSSEQIVLQHPDLPPMSPANLRALLKAAGDSQAAAAAVPVTSTYKQVVDGYVRSTLPRDHLFLLHGVMVIDRRRLAEALESDLRSGWGCTDEVSLCRRAGIPVQLVPGDYSPPPADQ